MVNENGSVKKNRRGHEFPAVAAWLVVKAACLLLATAFLSGPLTAQSDSDELQRRIREQLRAGSGATTPSRAEPSRRPPEPGKVTPGTSGPVVRVLLDRYRGKKMVTLTAASSWTVRALSGTATGSLPAGTVIVTCADGGLVFNGMVRTAGAVVMVATDQAIERRPYRGQLALHPEGGAVTVVNHLPLEDYLCGVLPLEVSPAWAPEALKSMAVVARTYAVMQRQKARLPIADLDDTVNSQVYGGRWVEHPATTIAVRATAGMVLVRDDEPIWTFFHSTCGGRTASGADVFGGTSPACKSVACDWCKAGRHFAWETNLPRATVIAKLTPQLPKGFLDQPLIAVEAGRKWNCGRVAEMIFVNAAQVRAPLDMRIVRRELGWDVVKSQFVRIELAGEQVNFKGNGHGHGVGLCQWGAQGQGLAGRTVQEILSFYYNAVQLRPARPGKEW